MMIHKKQVTRRIAIVIISLFSASANAAAGGFLADTFVKPFSPMVADRLDEINRVIGHSLEHAAQDIRGQIEATAPFPTRVKEPTKDPSKSPSEETLR